MNVGVVGAGNIAERAHLPALKSIPSIRVAGIADIDEKKAKKIAARFQIPRWYTDYRELMDDDTIRLIHVCTPPQFRLEVIESAAKKGKHLLVEKPLALSLDEAVRIRRAVREHNVALTVVQNYRLFPSVTQAKQRVSGGYLGNIVSMQGTALTPHPANQTRALHYYHPGGALFDFCPHLIDMLLWINESLVEKVFAFGGDYTGNMRFINYAQILLYFENKAIAVADTSWLTGIEGVRFTINIHGTGGHILLDVRNDSLTEFHGVLTPIDDFLKSISKAAIMSRAVLTGSYFKGAMAYYRQLIVAFEDAIQNNARPAVTVEQALMTTAVLEAAKRSIEYNKPMKIGELFSSPSEFDEICQSLEGLHE
jgi:predicted dehydrogenase